MSREIKFRGKRLDNGVWVYFNLHGAYVDENGNEISPKRFIRDCGFKVVPETVGQYTGLRDRNGKEIYEGDIASYTGQTGNILIRAYGLPDKWAQGEKFIFSTIECGLVARHISSYGDSGYHIPNCIIKGWRIIEQYDLWNHQRGFEVIGNIYHNPELLRAQVNE